MKNRTATKPAGAQNQPIKSTLSGKIVKTLKTRMTDTTDGEEKSSSKKRKIKKNNEEMMMCDSEE